MATFDTRMKLIIFIMILAVSMAHSRKPKVKTRYGKIKGVTTLSGGHRITKFLGIPYAKPPVGNLRFMKPTSPDSWKGVFHATGYRPACNALFIPDIQFNFLNYTIQPPYQSEDCLYLNIFIPGEFKLRKKSPKAVMVYIHGGSLISGSSNIYRGEELATSEDIIVVTINYRLGLFGFMASDDDTLPGNQGLFDQQAALKWIKDNIAAFGGDSSRITIFGQSAGGDAVLLHLLNPVSEKLFSRAIILSASSGSLRPRSGQYEILKNIFSPKCGAIDTAQTLLMCLQGMSVQEIMFMHLSAIGNGYLFFCADGTFIPFNFNELIFTGQFNRNKEVMTGFMRDDGDTNIPTTQWKGFVQQGIDAISAENLIPVNFRLFPHTPSNIDVVNDLVFQKYINNETQPLQIARGVLNMLTDSGFASKAFLIADILSTFDVDTYLFRFDHYTEFVEEFLEPNMQLYGGHAQEMMYMFRSGFVPLVNELFTDEEKLLASSFMHSFAGFAKTGKAAYTTKSNHKVTWTSYTPVMRQFVVFNTDMTAQSLQPVPVELTERMTFWNTIFQGF